MARDTNGDATSAEPAFRKALEQDPNDFDANRHLGSTLYNIARRKRRNRFSIVRFTPADPPTARNEMAMWESTSGKYDYAAKDLEALVNSDSEWLDPHGGAGERLLSASSARRWSQGTGDRCPA